MVRGCQRPVVAACLRLGEGPRGRVPARLGASEQPERPRHARQQDRLLGAVGVDVAPPVGSDRAVQVAGQVVQVADAVGDAGRKFVPVAGEAVEAGEGSGQVAADVPGLRLGQFHRIGTQLSRHGPGRRHDVGGAPGRDQVKAAGGDQVSRRPRVIEGTCSRDRLVEAPTIGVPGERPRPQPPLLGFGERELRLHHLAQRWGEGVPASRPRLQERRPAVQPVGRYLQCLAQLGVEHGQVGGGGELLPAGGVHAGEQRTAEVPGQRPHGRRELHEPGTALVRPVPAEPFGAERHQGRPAAGVQMQVRGEFIGSGRVAQRGSQHLVRLVVVEHQVPGADLDQLPGGAQPLHRERQVQPGREDQPQPGRRLAAQRLHEPYRRTTGRQYVQVVEGEAEAVPGAFRCPRSGRKNRRQTLRGLRIVGVDGPQRVDPLLRQGGVQGVGEAAQEHRQRRVVGPQRVPHAVGPVCYPGREQGRLARTRAGHNGREPGRAVQHSEQPGPMDRPTPRPVR